MCIRDRNRFTAIIQQYELFLNQGQRQQCKTCEKQLAYLVRVTNSLFSYGLPSGANKLNTIKARRYHTDEELVSNKMNQNQLMDQQQE